MIILCIQYIVKYLHNKHDLQQQPDNCQANKSPLTVSWQTDLYIKAKKQKPLSPIV